jgi:hypothetical protein
MAETEKQVNDKAAEAFGYTLDSLRADAVAAVDNPFVREAIERIKHGHAAEGFKNKFDKAYHSHSKTR